MKNRAEFWKGLERGMGIPEWGEGSCRESWEDHRKFPFQLDLLRTIELPKEDNLNFNTFSTGLPTLSMTLFSQRKTWNTNTYFIECWREFKQTAARRANYSHWARVSLFFPSPCLALHGFNVGFSIIHQIYRFHSAAVRQALNKAPSRNSFSVSACEGKNAPRKSSQIW